MERERQQRVAAEAEGARWRQEAARERARVREVGPTETRLKCD